MGRLFESLFEQRQGRDDKPHFGLGLYIVRLIAEFHGGTARRGQSAGRRRRDFHRHAAADLGQQLGSAARIVQRSARDRHALVRQQPLLALAGRRRSRSANRRRRSPGGRARGWQSDCGRWQAPPRARRWDCRCAWQAGRSSRSRRRESRSARATRAAETPCPACAAADRTRAACRRNIPSAAARPPAADPTVAFCTQSSANRRQLAGCADSCTGRSAPSPSEVSIRRPIGTFDIAKDVHG